MSAWFERFERKLAKLVTAITGAAEAFERRWTLAALWRVDPDLARRLEEQRALWLEASSVGDEEDIEVQGAALVRGFRAAVARMEERGAADDAYLVGRCPKTGLVVAVGHQKAAAERVREVHGPDAIWISPDEVAELLAGLPGLKALFATKRAWPGSEVVAVRKGGEAAQGCGSPVLIAAE